MCEGASTTKKRGSESDRNGGDGRGSGAESEPEPQLADASPAGRMQKGAGNGAVAEARKRAASSGEPMEGLPRIVEQAKPRNVAARRQALAEQSVQRNLDKLRAVRGISALDALPIISAHYEADDKLNEKERQIYRLLLEKREAQFREIFSTTSGALFQALSGLQLELLETSAARHSKSLEEALTKSGQLTTAVERCLEVAAWSDVEAMISDAARAVRGEAQEIGATELEGLADSLTALPVEEIFQLIRPGIPAEQRIGIVVRSPGVEFEVPLRRLEARSRSLFELALRTRLQIVFEKKIGEITTDVVALVTTGEGPLSQAETERFVRLTDTADAVGRRGEVLAALRKAEVETMWAAYAPIRAETASLKPIIAKRVPIVADVLPILETRAAWDSIGDSEALHLKLIQKWRKLKDARATVASGANWNTIELSRYEELLGGAIEAYLTKLRRPHWRAEGRDW